jgi:hypothetical protein
MRSRKWSPGRWPPDFVLALSIKIEIKIKFKRLKHEGHEEKHSFVDAFLGVLSVLRVEALDPARKPSGKD